MAFATNGKLRIHYDSFGVADAPAVLLLSGTGRQSIDFDPAFCAAFTAHGYRVIRFDTRDTGLSDGLAGTPSNLDAVYQAALAGGQASMAYSLADLADDALAVLDAAGAPDAHLIGRSLGSSVAQMLALRAPERVHSLSLVMANSRSVAPDVAEAVIARICAETITNGDDFAARQVRAAQAGALPQDVDAERITREAAAMWDRGIHAGGIARHFAAAIGMADLRPRLGALAIPTLVLHGRQDRTIPPRYAEETAEAIPGARLEMIDDMSHDGAPRVRQLWLPHIHMHLASVALSGVTGNLP